MFRKMSLTVTQSKFNSANAQIVQPNHIQVLPFAKKNFSTMSLSIASSRAIPAMIQAPPVINPRPYIQETPTNVNVPKMLWGKPTWYLLHMMAEKINDAKFPELRMQILNVISSICNNLPCPTCASHAKDYLNKIRFMNIQTKAELKTALFNFHNDVNQRKGYAIFSRQDLDKMYMTADSIVIVHNFILAFNKKNKSIRLLADDLSRQNITNSLKTWFQQNIVYFDPPMTPLPN